MLATSDSPRAVTDWRFSPPTEVLTSQLFVAGGYLIVSGLVDEATLQGLRAEAEALRPDSVRQWVTDSDGTEGRGGSPARALRSIPGRDLHWGLHGSPDMAAALASLCGATVSATGSGTYSCYEEPGDFLALHRDILQCDIAVITCLTPGTTSGPTGELTVYPGFIREPLSTVRAAGRQYGTLIALDRGHTVVLLGGLVPHEVTPICRGQERIVAINCYRIETAEAADTLETEATVACR
jgi:hypothetical protein